MDLSPSPRGRDTIRPQLTGQIQGRQPKSLWLEWSEGVPPVRDFQVPVTEIPGSGGFGQNHSPEVERGEKASTRSPSPLNQLELHSPLLLALLLLCALFRLISSPPERPPVPGSTSCSSAAPSRAWYGPAGAHPGTGYKGPAAAADCGLKMRPKELGQGSAGDWPGPGYPAAVTPAPPPAANPAPELSAEPESAPVQVPAAGQAAGSGSATVSGPSAGARPASKAGSEAGVQRASVFSAVQGNAQSVPDNSDAPWTRFIFQGPFGPRAAGLGTGKAAGIWKTPAAYIGRRPGVSGPERASFIRELEEGKLGLRTPGAGGTRAAAGRRGPRRVRAPGPLWHSVPPLRPPLRSHGLRRLSGPLFPTSFSPSLVPYFRRWVRSPGLALPCPPLHACCCSRSAHSQCPPPEATAVPGEGRGAAGGRCPVRSEPALARRASDGEVGGQRGGFANLLAAGVKIGLPPLPPNNLGGGRSLRQKLPLLFPPSCRTGISLPLPGPSRKNNQSDKQTSPAGPGSREGSADYWGYGEDIGGRKGTQSSPLLLTLAVEGRKQ